MPTKLQPRYRRVALLLAASLMASLATVVVRSEPASAQLPRSVQPMCSSTEQRVTVRGPLALFVVVCRTTVRMSVYNGSKGVVDVVGWSGRETFWLPRQVAADSPAIVAGTVVTGGRLPSGGYRLLPGAQVDAWFAGGGVTMNLRPIESGMAATVIVINDWLRSRLTPKPVRRTQSFVRCTRDIAEGFLDETVTRDWSDVLAATIRAGGDCGGVLRDILDWAHESRPRASAEEAVVLAGDDMLRRGFRLPGWLDDLIDLFGRASKVFA